jgi:hypothetical protein
MEFTEIYNWFMGLGEPYGVDPVIFGSIYVGAIPIFWLAINSGLSVISNRNDRLQAR